MKKLALRLIPVLLAFALVCPVTGQAEGILSLFAALISGSSQPDIPVIPYSQMEYTRPDLARLQTLLDEACALAQGKDADAILAKVDEFFEAYDWFYTASALANIRYSADLSDGYWAEENTFCAAAAPTAEQMVDTLYAALADSPCRQKLEQDYFGIGGLEGYGEESLWSDEMVALMERENLLISQYYAQSNRSSSILGWFSPGLKESAQTLADLIAVRSQMAACAGYDSYEALANELYYYRDYDPEELSDYLTAIRDTLVPLYLSAWETVEEESDCSPQQALDFVRQAAQAMGGTVWDAFRLMEEAGLYDIEAGRNKFDSCFEVFLPSYQEPFLFLCPYGTASDQLTLAHEFGHFCNDYASLGTIAGVDVCEVFSQGFEYLALLYHPEAEELTRYKMADSLATYVEQAAYARFEQQMYLLPEPTVQDLCDLYTQVAAEYGLVDDDFSPWDFVTIPHFYSNPMYISSYIISNDAALQLYQLEQDEPGRGLKLYQGSLDTQQPYFMAFLEEAGLESPFAPGRLEAAAETFRAFFPAA